MPHVYILTQNMAPEVVFFNYLGSIIKKDTNSFRNTGYLGKKPNKENVQFSRGKEF